MVCKTCEDLDKLRRLFYIISKIENTKGIGITCLDCDRIICNEEYSKEYLDNYKHVRCEL